MVFQYLKICLFFILCLRSISAWAGVFDISPIRLEMSNDQKVAVLRIRNTSNQPVVFQATIKKWLQRSEKDIYKDTRELIATPPIVTLDPGEQRMVRVGRVLFNPIKVEQAYRLYLRQISSKTSNLTRPLYGLRFMVNISVPIFVVPETVQKHFMWRVNKTKQNQYQLYVENQGNTHIQFKHLTVFSEKQKILWNENVFTYVLPKQHKTWQFILPTSIAPIEKVQLIVSTDAGEFTENDVYVQ